MKKRKSPDRTVCLVGKVVFEFFNNEEEEFKIRSLKSLSKSLRKDLNISCLHVEEHQVENPERGALVFSLCAANLAQAKETLGKAMTFLDSNAPARIIDENFEEIDII